MKTLLNIKIDPLVKNQAQQTARELGLPLSTIINAFLKQFVRTKEVYFSTIPTMSSALERLLGKVEQDIKHKKNISPTFVSAVAMDAYLDEV